MDYIKISKNYESMKDSTENKDPFFLLILPGTIQNFVFSMLKVILSSNICFKIYALYIKFVSQVRK